MRKIFAVAAQVGSVGRPCTTAPDSLWLSMQAKVEAFDYRAQKAELSAACGNIYTIAKTGNRVELFVDPTNGDIVGKLRRSAQ